METTKDNLAKGGISVSGDIKVYGDFIATGGHKNVTYKGGKHYHSVPQQQQAESQEGSNSGISDNELRNRINRVMANIKNKRYWFCIIKVLMLRGEVKNKDFEGAAKRIRSLYPAGLEHDIDPADLMRMHFGSFTLPIDEWKKDDGPVKREAEFRQYVNLARQFDALFK